MNAQRGPWLVLPPNLSAIARRLVLAEVLAPPLALRRGIRPAAMGRDRPGDPRPPRPRPGPSDGLR